MWVTILQFLASLSILIVLHECGHFFPAKWFKVKVEKFYLFFDPWFEIFKYKKGDTEYGIGWLPLGGYVKIAGMIDESFDKEQMEGPPQPWEFRSKPAWQRLIIMLGGVIVNFILGYLLFSMIFYTWGEEYIATDQITQGVYVDSLGYAMGLRDGDKILKIGDTAFEKFNPGAIVHGVAIKKARTITVERNGKKMDVSLDDSWTQELTKYENRGAKIIALRYPAVVASIASESKSKPGEEGLKEGDQIIGVDGKETPTYHHFEDFVLSSTDENTNLSVLRGRDTLTVEYQTYFDKKQGMVARLLNKPIKKERKIGFYPKGANDYYKTSLQEFGVSESLGKGWTRSVDFVSDQVNAFGQMLSGKIKAKDSLGSFISIGKMFGTNWDWRRFWLMTATLSLLLGFINLLPIPALDGGHVMFLLYEVITGKKPNDKFLEYATLIGFVLLVGLMLYAMGLDISRL